MACYTEISSVTNTIKKSHIQYNLHSGLKHNFFYDKQVKFGEFLINNIFPY